MRVQTIVLPILGLLATAHVATAQVYSWPSAPPRVHAARAHWQIAREPLFYAGRFYQATGPTEFFDRHVMVRTGTYNGVPLYENSTLEPYSVVYVPIGGNLVRPYERRRDRDLAGTVGSRTPSFPVSRDVEGRPLDWIDDLSAPDTWPSSGPGRARWDWPTPTDPSGVSSAQPLAPLSAQTRTLPSASVPLAAGRPRETTNAGAYVQFKGARFYTSGRAVTHDIQRFARIGEVGSAPVFGEVGGTDKTIFIEVVPGGSLAPYTRR